MAYTNIDDPSANFQIKIYTGTGSAQSITFDGLNNMKPDMWWQCNRDLARGTYVADSSRGVTKYLTTFTSNADSTVSTYVTSFDTNGFTLGNGDTAVNNSEQSFVTWNWKANGGTTSSNTDGSVTSTVQANTDAGFSIVTYSSDNTSAETIGHGLGVVPQVVLVKRRNSANRDWSMYHKSLGNTQYIQLNEEFTAATSSAWWNDTSPTSSVFSIGTGNNSRVNSTSQIAYCFAEKQGYSKFGKYVGNTNTDGAFIYTGFAPAFVLIKKYDTASDSWVILDTARNPFNGMDARLFPDLSNAESTSQVLIDSVSNGFKMRTADTAYNGSGVGYIYMAFAENPFVTSTGIPTTAR
jgi:hypothetical protein